MPLARDDAAAGALSGPLFADPAVPGSLMAGHPFAHAGSAIDLVSRYSSKPATPDSRPTPDCLYPPKGMSGLNHSPPLIPTVPVRIRSVTRMARSRSADHTEPERP